MRFRFCGDLDCPDWILAEIATISKMSSIKAKQLCSLIVNGMLNDESIQIDRLEKLASDAKLELNDIRACVALVEFILKTSAKHSTSSDTLSSELQQLGLPKEHATSLCRVYEESQSRLEEIQRNSSLRLNNLVNMSWRVDYSFSSSHLTNLNEPTVMLKLNVNNPESRRIDSNVLLLDKTKINLLISELKQAKSVMSSIKESDLIN